MDLDWCIEENINNSTLFNDNSIISHNNVEKSKQAKVVNTVINNINPIKNKKELIVDECFNLELEVNDRLKVFEILNYLSFVSNNLRTIIRNKNLILGFDNELYNEMIRYLIWLYDACSSVKKHFICTKRKDLNIDNVFKPFKTSSYKFCNFKNSCSIHKNKSKTCDKNHFVFDMILIDIGKLIESLELITDTHKYLDNINWIFAEKILKITINDDSTYSFEKLDKVDNIHSDIPNVYYIDKNIIFKCFDVNSYVLNKMFEESSTFLNYNIQSYQIIIE